MASQVASGVSLFGNPLTAGHSFDPLPKVGPASAGMIMTPDEFDAISECDDGYRYELIHGVLIVSPIPMEAEAGPNELLGRLLGNYNDDHPEGKTRDGTLPERHVRTAGSRRRADRVIWTGLGRTPNPELDLPTIVVEFVSASRRDWRRDYVDKRQEYLSAGVKEYWIIDRFRRSMTVCRQPLSDPSETVVSELETYRTELLPGFELPLGKLLAVADRWTRT